jgi:hypothetical protein
VVGLYTEEVADADIVAGSPEEEYDSEDGHSKDSREDVEEEDMGGYDGQDSGVGQVFGLSRIKKL